MTARPYWLKADGSADWDAIHCVNQARMYRHAVTAESQDRSIAAFYGPRQQRAFIAKYQRNHFP